MNTDKASPHLMAKIVQGYVRHHRLAPDQLSDLIGSVHRALGQLGAATCAGRAANARCVRTSISAPRLCDLSRLRLPGQDLASAHQCSTWLEPR